MTYYLAIDIGASSGRHILGSLEDGRISLEEIYRFENGIKEQGGALVWDIEHLFEEVKRGIARCGELGKIPKTVAIDTWGVDYVLIDDIGEPIYPCVSYRDTRTEWGEREVSKILPQEYLYSRTGIQKLTFNTIYQLYCDKQSGKLEGAKRFLMIPEYLSYRLTGIMKNEYTNATTTGLVDARERDWDRAILSRLGIPSELFGALSLPTDSIGNFKKGVREELGFDCEVIFCPSHDTASAVAAAPIDESAVYISSGTWSLVGTENPEPQLSREAMLANFTNEGGIEFRCRFIKNIMGMWLFQEIRRNINKSLTYDEMMRLAMQSDFRELIDPGDMCFLSPENMIDAVRAYLGYPELPLPDVLSSVYHSLANSYKAAIEEIERISKKNVELVYICGGGSRDAYLNRLTASYAGKRVLAGLVESTAVGNLASQIMRDKKITLTEVREIIKNTFEIKEVEK